MPMHPQVPIENGESLVSWAARSAQAQTEMGLVSLLPFIGLNRKVLLAPEQHDLDDLAELFGAHHSQVALSAVTQLRKGMLQYRSEVFSSGFLSWRIKVFCPICTCEDASTFGRVSWQFVSTKLCHRHQIPLVRQHLDDPDDIFSIPTQLYNIQGGIKHHHGKPSKHTHAPMQQYVENRIAGTAGPDWMDGQRLDQVVHTAHLLGMIWLHGRQAKPRDMGFDQLLDAERAGHDIVAEGEAGVLACLRDILLAARKGGAHNTPQSSLGMLSRWLELNEDAGPIRSLVRAFILDNFPIKAGTVLLGGVVSQRLRHNLATLASEFGISHLLLEGALINETLLPPENDPPRRSIAFDCASGEVVAQKVKESVSLEGVNDYLGCEPVVARAIATEGFARRAFPENRNFAERRPKVLHRLTTASLDQFMATLFGSAIPVKEFQPNLIPIVRGAKAAHWQVGAVIRLMLNQKLAVYCFHHRRNFGGLLIDPLDLQQILNGPPGCAFLSKSDAARKLGISTTAISRLLTTATDDGSPFLRRVLVALNRKQTQMNVCSSDLEELGETHVSLGRLAKLKGIDAEYLFRELTAQSIHPLTCFAAICDRLYRLSDI